MHRRSQTCNGLRENRIDGPVHRVWAHSNQAPSGRPEGADLPRLCSCTGPARKRPCDRDFEARAPRACIVPREGGCRSFAATYCRSVKRRSPPLDSRPSQSFKCFLRISLYFSYRSRHGRFSIEMLSSYYMGRLLKRDLFGGGGARFFLEWQLKKPLASRPTMLCR
jgi:hypothetical protein